MTALPMVFAFSGTTCWSQLSILAERAGLVLAQLLRNYPVELPIFEVEIQSLRPHGRLLVCTKGLGMTDSRSLRVILRRGVLLQL